MTVPDEPSSLAGQYRWFARYNTWFNQRLYDACEGLSDAQRKEPRGAFFGSLHNTLNHLVVADQLWLLRFRQFALEQGWTPEGLGPEVLDLPQPCPLDRVPFDDWGALR